MTSPAFSPCDTRMLVAAGTSSWAMMEGVPMAAVKTAPIAITVVAMIKRIIVLSRRSYSNRSQNCRRLLTEDNAIKRPAFSGRSDGIYARPFRAYIRILPVWEVAPPTSWNGRERPLPAHPGMAASYPEPGRGSLYRAIPSHFHGLSPRPGPPRSGTSRLG